MRVHGDAGEKIEEQAGLAERPAVIHSSLYLPENLHEALRKIAFDERLKIHDLVLEGVDNVLLRRGYPSVETLKAKAAKK